MRSPLTLLCPPCGFGEGDEGDQWYPATMQARYIRGILLPRGPVPPGILNACVRPVGSVDVGGLADRLRRRAVAGNTHYPLYTGGTVYLPVLRPHAAGELRSTAHRPGVAR